MTEESAILDGPVRASVDCAIPGHLVRELVARTELEIEGLLGQLDDALRMADDAERRVRDHPALVGPGRADESTESLGNQAVGGAGDETTRGDTRNAGADFGIANGTRAGGVRTVSVTGSARTVKPHRAPGSPPGGSGAPAMLAGPGLPVFEADAHTGSPALGRSSGRPRTTVDTRPRPAHSDAAPSGGKPALGKSVGPTAADLATHPGRGASTGGSRRLQSHLVFKAGFVITLMAILLLKFG